MYRWIIWSCYQFCAESNNFRTTWMLLCWITWPFPSRDSQHMDISCPIWNILTHCMLNEKKHGVSDLYQMRTFLQGKAFGPHVFFGHFASLQLTEEPKSHLKMMHSRTTSCKEMWCRDDKTSSPKLQFRNVCEYQGRPQQCSQVSKMKPSWRALPRAGVQHGQGAPTPLTAGNSVVPATSGTPSSFSLKCYP